MGKIISVHEYTLKPGVPEVEFEAALRQATRRRLFDLPGLEAFYFVKGIKGRRSGRYAAVWVYTSRKAWEALWGPPERPVPKEEYPRRWRIWEEEILAPLLREDPDHIQYTTYEAFL